MASTDPNEQNDIKNFSEDQISRKFNDPLVKTQGMLSPGDPNLHINMTTAIVYLIY